MSVILGWWIIPAAITLAAWAWAILLPLPARSGDYDFSGPLSVMLRSAACIIVTLIVWLAYFAARVFLGG